MMLRTTLIVSGALALLACSSTNSSGGTGGTGGSGGGSGGGSDVSAFVGTWQYVSGTGTLTCPSTGSTSTVQGNGTLTITAGSTAGTVVATASASGCALVYTVTNGNANVNPGQTCKLTGTDSQNGATFTETRTPNTDVASISGGLLTVQLNDNDVINEGTQTINCTLSGSLTYKKL